VWDDVPSRGGEDPSADVVTRLNMGLPDTRFLSVTSAHVIWSVCASFSPDQD